MRQVGRRCVEPSGEPQLAARWENATGGYAPGLPGHTRPSYRALLTSAVGEPEADVVQPDRLARRGTEGAVVVGVVVRQRVHGGLRLLGRLHRDVPVARQARAGRAELAEDDVLLEAEQRVGLGLH